MYRTVDRRARGAVVRPRPPQGRRLWVRQRSRLVGHLASLARVGALAGATPNALSKSAAAIVAVLALPKSTTTVIPRSASSRWTSSTSTEGLNCGSGALGRVGGHGPESHQPGRITCSTAVITAREPD